MSELCPLTTQYGSIVLCTDDVLYTFNKREWPVVIRPFFKTLDIHRCLVEISDTIEIIRDE